MHVAKNHDMNQGRMQGFWGGDTLEVKVSMLNRNKRMT